MIEFIIRRILTLMATLMVAAILIFGVTEILPGDPAAVMLGMTANPETIAALRQDLGLDAPPMQRFFRWIIGFFTGDLGVSYAYRVPVAGLIAERAPVTVPLAFMAILFASLLGIALGAIAASRANRAFSSEVGAGSREENATKQKHRAAFWSTLIENRSSAVDAGIMAGAQIGLAIPSFWFGILLVLLFSISLEWFPAGGFPGWHAGFWRGLEALLLPAIALALPQGAVLARITRTSVLETLGEDFVRTARAKGLTRGQTLRRHVLRNALVPVFTMLAMQFSFLVAGTIVIENVFALPGLGRLMFQAIGGHDIITVKSLVMVFAGAVIFINALVDLSYGLIDPRLRIGRGSMT